jgi:hypothetical protein
VRAVRKKGFGGRPRGKSTPEDVKKERVEDIQLCMRRSLPHGPKTILYSTVIILVVVRPVGISGTVFR